MPGRLEENPEVEVGEVGVSPTEKAIFRIKGFSRGFFFLNRGETGERKRELPSEGSHPGSGGTRQAGDRVERVNALGGTKPDCTKGGGLVISLRKKNQAFAKRGR